MSSFDDIIAGKPIACETDMPGTACIWTEGANGILRRFSKIFSLYEDKSHQIRAIHEQAVFGLLT